jgi:hypothetical protein
VIPAENNSGLYEPTDWEDVVKHLALFCTAIIAVVGCGDDEETTVANGTCISSSDCPSGQFCVDSVCRLIDSGEVGFNGNDTETGTPDIVDVSSNSDSGPAPDLIPDTNAPTLTQSLPADGDGDVAVGVSIQLVFSEPVKNVDKNTVQLIGPDEEAVTVSFSKDATGQNWTVKPAAALRYASKYRVTVNFPTQVILDNAGNKFQGIAEFTFYTQTPTNVQKYDALASKYAPTIRLQTQDAAMYDYPTAANLDSDWDLTDNKAYLENPQTKQLRPAVHYTVIESESHYFIHYVAYWSVHNAPGVGGSAFQNETAGLTVVVEKWPTERPVEAITWFKEGASEYMRAFTTNESGILDANSDAESQGISKAYDEVELFINNRVDLFFTSGEHASCLWDETEATGCDITSGDKALLTDEIIEMEPGTVATTFSKNGTKWPKATADATGTDQKAVYVLGDLLPAWWVRRTNVGTMFHNASSNLTYSTGATEPVVVTFPRWWVDADGDQGDGRAPWAAQWKPGDNTKYIDLPIGLFFLDTANFLKQRHELSAYVNSEFNTQTKDGYSTNYCYNPYLEIDIRGTGNVCPQ